MRIIAILLLSLLTFTGYAQKRQKIDQLVVKDSLIFQGGSPAADKVAVSMDGNGSIKWVYLSDITDTINFDSLNINYINANTVRVNRDSFTDPAASIASIGDSGFIVECPALCTDIRWTTIDGTQTVLKDSTDNVGIGTSNPTAKFHVEGNILVVDTFGNLDSKLYSGDNVFLTSGFDNYDGTFIIGNDINNPNFVSYVGAAYDDGNDVLSAIITTTDTTVADSNCTIIVGVDAISLTAVGVGNQNGITITQNNGVAISGNLSITDGTEADGYVLTSDASGNATWQDPTAYGEMGFGDSTRTIALTQNVFSVVTNSNNTLWSTAAVDLHNVTYSGDSLIIDSAGTYQVNVQLSVEGTNASIIRMGVFINGALACTCTGWQQLSNNLIVQLTYINIDTFNVGDVVQVVVTNTANSDDVDAIAGKITINKIR